VASSGVSQAGTVRYDQDTSKTLVARGNKNICPSGGHDGFESGRGDIACGVKVPAAGHSVKYEHAENNYIYIYILSDMSPWQYVNVNMIIGYFIFEFILVIYL
jgi:hypothetical protein